MGDLDINKVLRKGKFSKSKLKKRAIYWFMKHYFCCDIHPDMRIADTVQLAHNGLGTVINQDAVIEDNVTIQHHVTIGRNHTGAPVIRGGVYIGAHAIILGNIEIGENAIIGAGAVVAKSIPANSTVVGNPAKIINSQ